MNKKILIFLLMGIFLISLTSAYDSHKQSTNYELVVSSNNATACDTTYIKFPNGSKNILNQEMTKDGTTFYSTINSGNFSSLGTTCLGISCTDGSTTEVGSKCLDVSKIGKEMNTSKASLYIFMFVFSVLIFIGLLILGIKLPISNKRDQMTGYILAVSNLKYFKIVCIGLAYMVGLFISYFSWMITYAYLDMNFVSKIFQFIFFFLTALVLPLFILLVYLLIANAIRDNKIKDMLVRGLRTR